MNIQQFYQQANGLGELSAKGRSVIEALGRYLASEPMKKYVAVKEQTQSSLTASFYGLQLVFRIELPWPIREQGDFYPGQIAVYWLSYDAEPTETRLKMEPPYVFDLQGNVTNNQGGAFRTDAFAPDFVTSVFTALADSKVTLRP